MLGQVEAEPRWWEAKLEEHPRAAALLREAIKSAATDEDYDQKATAYCKALRPGLADDAEIDEARLAVRTLRQLQPVHMRLLVHMDPRRMGGITEIQARQWSSLSESVYESVAADSAGLGLVIRRSVTQSSLVSGRSVPQGRRMIMATAWGATIKGLIVAEPMKSD